jgi:hypothetical protein
MAVASLVAVGGAAGRGDSRPKVPQQTLCVSSERLQLQQRGAKLDPLTLRPLPAACRSPLACTDSWINGDRSGSNVGHREIGSISLCTEETLETRSSWLPCSLHGVVRAVAVLCHTCRMLHEHSWNGHAASVLPQCCTVQVQVRGQKFSALDEGGH